MAPAEETEEAETTPTPKKKDVAEEELATPEKVAKPKLSTSPKTPRPKAKSKAKAKKKPSPPKKKSPKAKAKNAKRVRHSDEDKSFARRARPKTQAAADQWQAIRDIYNAQLFCHYKAGKQDSRANA